MEKGIFATAISCMDGRIQLAVNNYIRENFDIKYVDTITLAGPCKIIADREKTSIINNVKFRSDISLNIHLSELIAIVGHADCAGAPVTDEIHKKLILSAADEVRNWYPDTQIINLWVDNTWTVERL